jgi:hypothetical protein
MGTAATAPNAVARGAVTTSGLLGKTAARFNDDLFGTGTVFIPPSKLCSSQGALSAQDLFYSTVVQCCQPVKRLQVVEVTSRAVY